MDERPGTSGQHRGLAPSGADAVSPRADLSTRQAHTRTTTLTLHISTTGRWFVHSDNPTLPSCLRYAPAGTGPLLEHGPAAGVRQAVVDCNPGCRVEIENTVL